MDLAKVREYFATKLWAEKQVADVVDALEHERSELLLVDIRDRESYQQGHIPGAISMLLDEFDSRCKELPTGKEIVTYCYGQHCHLSTLAALKLVEKGIPAKELNVGWKEWVTAGYPTRSESNSTLECDGWCRT